MMSLVKWKQLVYAWTMAPKKSDKSAKEGRFSVRIDAEILLKFRAFALQDRRSFSKAIEIAMEERMDRNGFKQ